MSRPVVGRGSPRCRHSRRDAGRISGAAILAVVMCLLLCAPQGWLLPSTAAAAAANGGEESTTSGPKAWKVPKRPPQPTTPPAAGPAPAPAPAAGPRFCPELEDDALAYRRPRTQRRRVNVTNLSGSTLYLYSLERAGGSNKRGREVLRSVVPHEGVTSMRAFVGSMWIMRNYRGRAIQTITVAAEDSDADLVVTVSPCAARKLSTNFIYASDLHGVAEFSLTAGRAGGRSSRIASPDPNTRDVHVELADLMGIHSANLEWDRKVLCPICDGVGYPPSSLKDCPHCRGSGLDSRVFHAAECTHGNNVYDWAASGHRFRHNTSTTCAVCTGFGSVPRTPTTPKCSHCKGQGLVPRHEKHQVNFPAGARSDLVVVLAGAGDMESAFHVARDVHINLKVKEGGLWQRSGHDLIYTVKLTLAEALFGYNHTYTHIDGQVVQFVRTTPTPHGYKRRVPSVGLPIPPPDCDLDLARCVRTQIEDDANNRTRYGDLILEHTIVFPTFVSESGSSRLMDAFPSFGRRRRQRQRERLAAEEAANLAAAEAEVADVFAAPEGAPPESDDEAGTADREDGVDETIWLGDDHAEDPLA